MCGAYPLIGSPKGEANMSVDQTSLTRQISATWWRNAVIGVVATIVLAFFLILLP